MENMNQLKDLLKHEVKDLYSAEEQIIEALPKMIDKANNPNLRQALEEHFTITEMQKDRLDKVLDLLSAGESKGFLSGLFGGSKADEKCKAMEGLITEGKKLMEEDMSPEVSDAAIIAAAQKIEHYEISSYGTARAYAQELGLNQVEALLQETLDEEYLADDTLTLLAERRINEQAIDASSSSRNEGRHRSTNSTSRRAHAEVASNRRSSSSKRGKSSSNGSPKKISESRSRSSSTSSRGRKTSRGRSGNR